MPSLFKTFQECQHYYINFLLKLSMALKVIKGHIRPPLCQNHSNTFVYVPECLMKICMTANIINTTLTYVLMDNFCPCFIYLLHSMIN